MKTPTRKFTVTRSLLSQENADDRRCACGQPKNPHLRACSTCLQDDTTPTTPAPQAGHTHWIARQLTQQQMAISGTEAWGEVHEIVSAPHGLDATDSVTIGFVLESDHARLIASAPDLLAFAQRALRIFLAWQHDANPDGDLKPGESADFDAATLNVEAARAALAQAEGRA